MRIPITLTNQSETTPTEILADNPMMNRGQALSTALEAGLHKVQQDLRRHHARVATPAEIAKVAATLTKPAEEHPVLTSDTLCDVAADPFEALREDS